MSAPKRVPAPPRTTMTSSVSVKVAVVTSGVTPIRSSHMKPPQAARNAARTKTRLVRVRAQPDHLHPALVVADGAPDVPGRRSDRRPRDQNTHHHRRGKPVEVLRVENADEEVGESVDVEDDPLLAARQASGIRLDDHGAGLGEGERDHREGDPRHPQAHGAEHERHGDGDDGEQRERCGRPPPWARSRARRRRARSRGRARTRGAP